MHLSNDFVSHVNVIIYVAIWENIDIYLYLQLNLKIVYLFV